MAALSAEIDACKYLYLREISEPRDNAIRLLVEEAKAADTVKSIHLPGIVIPGSEILSDVTCHLFELTWKFYVAYSIRNESYVGVDDSETIGSGKFLRTYIKSNFLDYVARSTFANHEHPGPLHHVEVICLNHIVDVVSTVNPQISKIRPAAPISNIKPLQ